MSNTDKVANVFMILVFITIITLKITGILKLSWLLLFSPLIVTFIIGVILALGFTIAYIISLYKNKRRNKYERY